MVEIKIMNDYTLFEYYLYNLKGINDIIGLNNKYHKER